jgi:hypothetical protein
MDGGLGLAIDRLAAIDPSSLSASDLHDLVMHVTREESRLAAAKARLVATWDAQKQWADNGSKAATARLMLDAFVSADTARRDLFRARRLRTMPSTTAALAEGKLSMDHADLLMRANRPEIAHLFARDESLLVDQIKTMRHPSAQRCVRYWRNMIEDEAGRDPSDGDRDGRRLTAVRTFRGRVAIDGMLDPIAGSVVVNELQRLEQRMFQQDWAEAREKHGELRATAADLERTPCQRRADALEEMARRSASMDPSAVMPRPLFTILVGYEGFSNVCELSDGTVVGPRQLVPYLADADIERIVFEGPSRVIDVGARRRFFTGALRRAIEVRDRHCTHPSGCDVPAEHCEIDHIEPYSHGGLTTQSNGRCRCSVHNRQRGDRPDAPDDG